MKFKTFATKGDTPHGGRLVCINLHEVTFFVDRGPDGVAVEFKNMSMVRLDTTFDKFSVALAAAGASYL